MKCRKEMTKKIQENIKEEAEGIEKARRKRKNRGRWEKMKNEGKKRVQLVETQRVEREYTEARIVNIVKNARVRGIYQKLVERSSI